MRVGDVRLNCLRLARLRQAASKRGRLRQRILNVRIAFDSRDIRTCRQRFGDLVAALYQNRVHNVKGAMLNAALTLTIEGSALVLLGSYSLATS